MRFLLIDSADARGCVALFEGLEPLAVRPHPGEDDYSSWLLPTVESILATAGLTHADLKGYAVCSGPGSFTGLRVGLTTVKAWAEVFAKPIAAVSRLQALATAAPRAVSSGFVAACPVAAYLDARRGQIFATLIRVGEDGAEEVHEPESVIAPQEFLNRVNVRAGRQPVLWRSPDLHLLEALPGFSGRLANGDSMEHVDPPFAAQLGAAAHAKFVCGDTTDALSLDANYVRRSDAELFWKDHPSAVKA